jgi:spore germination protein KC
MPLIGLCFILLSGCWDYAPIETLFNVAGIAIDRSKAHPKQIEITLIAVNYQKTKVLLKSEGHSISDAINHIQNATSKKVVLSHLQFILFSDGIARSGLLPFLDLFFRDMQMRVDSTFAIVKGSAAKAFENNKFKYPVTARTFPYLLKTSESKFNPRLFQIHNIMLQTTSANANFVLPFFKMDKKKKQMELAGLSLIRAGKQVDVLTRDEMKLYMLIRREMKQLTYMYGKGGVGNNKARSITFRLHVRKPNVHVRVVHGHIHFTYWINITDEIVEINPWESKPVKQSELKKIEKKVQSHLVKSCSKLVKKVQKENHFDPFGLSEEARVHAPSIYRAERWNQQFSAATFTFHVKIHLNRYGQLF